MAQRNYSYVKHNKKYSVCVGFSFLIALRVITYPFLVRLKLRVVLIFISIYYVSAVLHGRTFYLVETRLCDDYLYKCVNRKSLIGKNVLPLNTNENIIRWNHVI